MSPTYPIRDEGDREISGYIVVDGRVGSGRGSDSGKVVSLDVYARRADADRWLGIHCPTEASKPNRDRSVKIKGVIELDQGEGSA